MALMAPIRAASVVERFLRGLMFFVIAVVIYRYCWLGMSALHVVACHLMLMEIQQLIFPTRQMSTTLSSVVPFSTKANGSILAQHGVREIPSRTGNHPAV